MPVMEDVPEESVYNLIPRPQVTLQRPPMHTSKFADQADAKTFSGSAPKRAAATMGRAGGLSAEHPTNFLRKHTKEPVLPDPAPPSSPKHKFKPPVPPRADVPVMGLMSDKNWVVANAVEAITGRPTQRVSGTAARPGRQPEINYTQWPGFGKVPTYLRRNKAAIADEQQQIETFLRMRGDAEGAGCPQARPMSGEERGELLAHLKAKWAAVNAAYLKIGFVLDIESKIKRKEMLEAELASIEADIKLLQRGDVVMVMHDA